MLVKTSIRGIITKTSVYFNTLKNIQSYSAVMSKFELPSRFKDNDKSVW